jgi:hypothetical protein
MNLSLIKTACKRFLYALKIAMTSEPDIKIKNREEITKRLNPAGHYVEWLKGFHTEAKPSNYLEIGVKSGRTLTLAEGDTEVFGVDPAYSVHFPLNARTRLFRCTSDEFFKNDLSALRIEAFSLCFIDGLHEYHQVVRDVINVANYCDDSSIIILHDVIPPNDKSSDPKGKVEFCSGDVYKALPFFNTIFPHVKITIIRTAPTGLAVLTNVGSIKISTLPKEISHKNTERLKEFDKLSLKEFMGKWLPRFESVNGYAVDVARIKEIILSTKEASCHGGPSE